MMVVVPASALERKYSVAPEPLPLFWLMALALYVAPRYSSRLILRQRNRELLALRYGNLL